MVVVNSLRPDALSLKGIYTLFSLSIAYNVVMVSSSKGKAVPAAKTLLAHALFLSHFFFFDLVYSFKAITHPSETPDPPRVHSRCSFVNLFPE
jgi:hypothetical protein